MRIGLMGGTFRPVHNGHLMIAKKAYEQLHLDEVWFVPNHSSPFKLDEYRDDANDRLQMLKLAIQDIPYFRINTVELDRKKISFSYQTVTCLHEQYPDDEFFFIMGGDSLEHFGSWYEPETICKYVTLAVAVRDENDLEKLKKYEKKYAVYHADIVFLNTVNYSVSSSEIRKKIADGQAVSGEIPDAVFSYIQAHGLYQDE